MRTLFLLAFSFFFLVSFSQDQLEKGLQTINKNLIQAELEFLSSDYLEGRELGQKGGYIAAEYIASLMKIYGLDPLFENYFQNFNVVELQQNEVNVLSVKKKTKNGVSEQIFQEKVDFTVELIELSRILEAPIVFAGYGITDENLGYDDYKGIDANGKFVFILDGFPGHNEKESNAFDKFFEKYTIRRYSKNYSKEDNAKAHGAIGIIRLASEYEVNTWNTNKHYYDEEDLKLGQAPNKSFWDKKFVLHEDKLHDELVEVRITERLAKFILNKNNFDFNAFEKQLTTNMKPASFEAANNILKLETKVSSELVTCRNVCGIIKGKDETKNIIIGAHYDHYGMANNYIWNGADDNGSGTVGMLTLAKAFAEMDEQPEHNLIFLAFDAEEKGLHGSRYFASQMPEDMDVTYMLNFDMISRNGRQDTLGNISYVIFSADKNSIRENYDKLVADHNLNLDLTYYPSDGKVGGSDHAPFARKGIPYSFFWSGWHDDYHNPGDEYEKINWNKMLDLCKLGFIHVYEIDKNGIE